MQLIFRIWVLLTLLASPLIARSVELDLTSVVSVQLERTACFGTCPSYVLTASRSGTVTFNGNDHVKTKGDHKGKISQNDFHFLAEAVSRVQFLTFRQSYASKADGCTELWTDSPSIRITVQLTDQTKSVVYYTGCRGPNELSHLSWLADTVDEVTQSQNWVGP
jgi:hypothetical protein